MRVPSATRMKSWTQKYKLPHGVEPDVAYRKSMDDDHSFGLFDDIWENTESGRDASIASRKVHASVGARVPDYVRRVDGILNLIHLSKHRRNARQDPAHIGTTEEGYYYHPRVRFD